MVPDHSRLPPIGHWASLCHNARGHQKPQWIDDIRGQYTTSCYDAQVAPGPINPPVHDDVRRDLSSSYKSHLATSTASASNDDHFMADPFDDRPLMPYTQYQAGQPQPPTDSLLKIKGQVWPPFTWLTAAARCQLDTQMPIHDDVSVDDNDSVEKSTKENKLHDGVALRTVCLLQ